MATFNDHKLWWWLDIETTGSDKENHSILEVAWIITDPDLNQLHKRSFLVAAHEPVDLRKVNRTVAEMHIKNKLWEHWMTSGAKESLGSIQSSYRKALEDLGHKKGERVLLCGSGAGRFDKPFLDYKHPGFCNGTAYYDLDISVLRRFFNWDTDFQGKSHRALDDCYQAIDEFRFYRDRCKCL